MGLPSHWRTFGEPCYTCAAISCVELSLICVKTLLLMMPHSLARAAHAFAFLIDKIFVQQTVIVNFTSVKF